MNILVNFESILVGCTSKEYTKKDGSKGNFNKVSLVNEGEAFNLNCSDDVYKKISGESINLSLKTIYAEYNTDYNSMKVVDVC